MHIKKSSNHSPRGFTIIELLIVITILGLLMSLVAPKMLGKADGAQRKVAMAQMQNFETALDTFRLDVGRYPENLSELRVSNRRGWDGPYLPKKLPMDPWNNPYVYEVPGDDGQPYMLKSLAKDGLEGGTEDNKDIFHQ